MKKPLSIDQLVHGPDGLRAGWSLLVFALPFAILYALNSAAKHFTGPSTASGLVQITPGETALMEAIYAATVIGISFLLSRLESRPFGRYGLGGPRRLRDLAHGLVWGLVLLSLLIGVLRITHLLAFDGIALHGTTALLYALKWAATFLLVGLFEEFAFRGFVQYTAARGLSGVARALLPQSLHTHAIGFWLAALLFSVGLFAGLHSANAGESPLGLLAVAAAGITFAYSLWRTGTLWWAIGFHAAWDWAQSFLYGVADSGGMVVGHLLSTHPTGAPVYSGGTTGPEGSLFVFPTLALAALVIHLTLPRRPYPLTPSQMPPTEAFTLSEDASA